VESFDRKLSGCLPIINLRQQLVVDLAFDFTHGGHSPDSINGVMEPLKWIIGYL
jgi:hypothetical protein